MVAALNRENEVYLAVESGELSIDTQGRVWRHAARRANRWKPGEAVSIPCEPRRAEHLAGKYQQVRVMFGGKRIHALAHRLVWRHFNGPIPAGLTVNHKNGRHTDNRPSNLELSTSPEQTRHSRKVLRRGIRNQYGPLNPAAKLSTEQVQEICSRRADGELLRVLAADYGVSQQTISKIARGDRRLLG